MKLLLVDFGFYSARMQGNLTWNRIGKTPLVILHETRPYSFCKSIAAHILYKIHYYSYWKLQRLEDDRKRVLFPQEFSK